MRARQIEVFSTVMRTGTITAAARLLNISQPALSQMLLHTESELGFALFERTKGRLIPTPEALELFPEVERLFSGLEGIRRKTKDLRLGRAGLVRIAASAPPAMSILPIAFRDFHCKHPEIVLRSHMAPIQSIIDMLREGDACIGLAMDDHLPPDISVEPLGKVGFVCLLPERHRLTELTAVPFQELVPEPLISYRANTRPAEELGQAARSHQVELKVQIEIDVSISAVGFVQAGMGVALVDALLPWHQFSGVTTRPIEASPGLPASLLTLPARPLSVAEELMKEQIRTAAAQVLTPAS
ncbi:LysR substrate-binding domain-containing protein [Mesorhizobium sp.]|uniref:LysR substrate-binding domain-containing protein n=1 Tax=Mesorhizobium sp. TaxID=1871066 RepID=UPI0025F2DA73|nr:LysR substrate-binding domain-containing protein [Mesorhizobium sp.]